MLTTYRQAYKTLVYSQIASGSGKLAVGFFIDFIINPDDGVVVALWVETLQGKKCLDPGDIIHWRSSEILIGHTQDCYDPNESPKIKKICEKECPILGTNVYGTMSQRNLGQVRNFGFDTISPRILSLHVRPNWWQPWKQLIIPHQLIEKITLKGIAVKDLNTLKTKSGKLQKVTAVIKSVEESPKVDCKE